MSAATVRRFLILVVAFVSGGCSFFRPPVPDVVPFTLLHSAKGAFEAGAAVVSITPDRDLYLGGYGRMRLSEGVHDPIHARALLLRRGDLEVALVALDLIGVQGNDIERMREGIDGFDAARVIIASTHTHSAPDTLGLWGQPLFFYSGIDDAYMKEVTVAVAAAISAARKSLRPAELAATEADLDEPLALLNLRHPGLVDRTIGILSIREAGGGDTIATLVEVGCHPEVLGPKNNQITADYPAAMVAELEQQLGGIGIYVSGAVGGLVTPNIERSVDWSEGGSFDDAEAFGRRLGRLAVTAASSLRDYEAQPDFDIRHSDIYLRVENFLYSYAHFGGIVDRQFYGSGYVKSDVNLWRLGSLTLASVPGEITPDLGLRIAELAGGGPFILVGLANDELGYLLPEAEYDLPIFQYERTLCVNRRAGDRIVRRLRDLDLCQGIIVR